MSLLHKIGQKPVIAAIRNSGDVEAAIRSKVDNIFFMSGTLADIGKNVKQAREAGIGTFVHLDLIRGLSSTDKESIAFIAEFIKADGIVTPKGHLIKEAKKLGLYAIYHLFILDTTAMNNAFKMIESVEPDAIELMPGLLEKVITSFAKTFEQIPIIASGLIHTREEAVRCLQAGATSLSVSQQELWGLTFGELFQG